MRRRLFLYLILALLPLAVLSVWLAFDEEREEDAHARAEGKAAVDVVRADVDRLFQSSGNIVRGLAGEKSEDRICESLPAWRGSFPEFVNLGVVDVNFEARTGRIVCSVQAVKDPAFAVATNGADVREPGQLTVSPIRPNLHDARPILPLSALMKVLPDGRRRLVSAAIDLGWFNDQVNRIPIPDRAVLIVVDSQGAIAAHMPRSRLLAPGTRAPDFELGLLKGPDFDGEVSGEGGVARYYVQNRVGASKGLTIILKIRSSDIYARSRSRLLFHLGGLLGVTTLVFLLAWRNTSRFTVGPIARLASVADRLAAGSLSERSGLKLDDELGWLARSFDRMAASLQKEKAASAEMLESLRSLTARMDSIAQEERSRFAREIHDELGQQLTVMRFELARLERAPDGAMGSRIQDLIALVNAAIREVRRISTELRPLALDNGGLTGALLVQCEEFRKRTNIACRATVPDRAEPDDARANCLLRVCQEALLNVTRHAKATAVDVILTEEEGFLTLTIRDNGCGFDPAQTRAGAIGILGMRERVRIVGGTFEIVSAPGGGTTVVARVSR